MWWSEFVEALGYSERHAYRLYRAPEVREEWGKKLDMKYRAYGVGVVQRRLHLDRTAGLAVIQQVREGINGGEDEPAY